MGERSTATIRPVKVREYDAEMHCDVLRVVCFEVECKCGWRSSRLPHVGAAKAALGNHRARGHKPAPEAVSATSETAA